MTSSPRRTALAVLTLVACAVLGACGSDDAGSLGNLSEAVDAADGQVEIETGDGSVSGGVGDELPEGFPVDDVPLVEGQVQSGFAITSGSDEGFTVVILVEEADHDAAVALLTDRGFTTEGSFSAAGSETSQLSSDAWEVLLTTTEAGGEASVSYTVARPS